MRPAALFALLVLAGLILFGVGIVKVQPSSAITPETSSTRNQRKNQAPDPAGTVNGAYDANKIPDHVALALMFRLIQKHRVEHQDKDFRVILI